MLYEVITTSLPSAGRTSTSRSPSVATCAWVLPTVMKLLIWSMIVITSYSIHYTKLYERVLAITLASCAWSLEEA